MPFTPTFRTAISLAITLTAAHPAIASPIRLSHQGRLLDETGAPLEGEHELTIGLVTEAGDVLWIDSVPVAFQHGFYHVVLGDHAPLDDGLFRGGAPTLEIAVDDGAPLRVDGKLTHVPYAAVAEWARAAEHAQRAEAAGLSDRAVRASAADRADHADTATRAEQSENAAHANVSDSATHADTATLAQRAENATRAEGIAGGALTLDRLDANAVIGAHHQGDTAIFGTVQAGRVNAIVALGAGSGLTCGPGNRGVMRYPPGGPLQVCDQAGWVDVGGGGPGTCSIVGECPGGEVPSRVWFDELSLVSPEAVEHLCSRYDRVLGKLRIHGRFSDAEFVQAAEIPCVDGVVVDIDSTASAGTIMPLVDVVSYDLLALGHVAFADLERVGRNLSVSVVTAESKFPSLQTVGGRLAWSWAEGVDTSLVLPDAIPVLESVGGTFGLSDSGPRVLAPSLTSVGGDYIAFNTEAPNLREVGGTLILSQPQPTFPALETVGGLRIHNYYSTDVRIDPPFSLDSLSSLRRIDGNLTISCVRGWELPELNAFVDRIGRDNIGGTITLRPSSDSRCYQ